MEGVGQRMPGDRRKRGKGGPAEAGWVSGELQVRPEGNGARWDRASKARTLDFSLRETGSL